MKWLLVLAAVGNLAAQCGLQPVPQSYDPASGTAISAAGGPYMIAITNFPSYCNWAAKTDNSPWITLGQTTGVGPGSGVTWTAAANPTNSPRAGYIYLSGDASVTVLTPGYWTIPVVQLANTCVPVLSATSASAAVVGGSGGFQVQTVCQWNVSGYPSWVTISPTSGTGAGSVNYTVAANGCVAGRTGTITAEAGTLYSSSSDSAAIFTINQAGSPNNLALSPATAAFDATGGHGTVNATTGSGCTWSAYTDSQNWIQIVNGASGSGTSGISYNVAANTGALRSGHIYVGTQVFTISQQAAAAPVPQLTVVVNSASYTGGPIAPIAPGEIVALGGTGLGPAKGVGAQLDVSGQSITTTLGGVRVLFDGKYPAALTYVSANQVNVIAPYEIAGEASTQIQVQYQGGTSAALQPQVQAAAPGIFTSDANGIGNGAVLNQDYSVNGASNPAPRGSTVMIYCTGTGATSPPSTDAALTVGTNALALQPVTVTIGGVPVSAQQVPYAGGAPGAVAGLTQINAVVPANAPTGAGVSLAIRIGTWQSQAGVTMAVQ